MWMAYFTERRARAHVHAGAPARACGERDGADASIQRRLARLATRGPRRPAARRRRPDLPARRPAGEDGHREHGALARGALAACSTTSSWSCAPASRLVEAERRHHEEALQGRAAPVAPRPHPRPARSWASAFRSRSGSAAHFAIFRARSCSTGRPRARALPRASTCAI